MYLEYYSFVEEPFSVTADPKFLYLSESHEEALAHLLFAVQNRRGFVAITGGVGTGKTMLLNSLLTRFDDSYTFAFIYQSADSTEELLRYIFKDLELEADYRSKSEYLTALNDFLLSEAGQQRNVVLIIDEAQNLAVEVLEDLRLISNLETAKRKLIQIVLAGQTELNTMLRKPELRQLNQRIAVRYQLHPLNLKETGEYIWHRLKIAGAPRDDIFHNSAIKEVFNYTKGVPRLINQLCDTALLKGALQKKPVLDGELIKSVVTDEFRYRDVDNTFEESVDPASTKSPAQSLPATVAATPGGGGFRWWWGVGVLLLLLLAAGWWLKNSSAGSSGENPPQTEVLTGQNISTPGKTPSGTPKTPAAGQKETPLPAGVQDAGTLPTPRKSPPAVPADRINARPLPVNGAARPISGRTMASSHTVPPPPPRGEDSRLPVRKKKVTENPVPEKDLSRSTRVRVRAGDWLAKIVRAHYGFVTWPLVDEVLRVNPQIRNPNFIRVGDRIVLPGLSAQQLAVYRRARPVM